MPTSGGLSKHTRPYGLWRGAALAAPSTVHYDPDALLICSVIITVRLAQGALVIFLVSIGTFGMMHLIPGDPISLMIGEARTSQEQIDAIRAKWGLDRPLHIQYLTWMGNMIRGDFGQSVVRGRGAGPHDDRGSRPCDHHLESRRVHSVDCHRDPGGDRRGCSTVLRV